MPNCHCSYCYRWGHNKMGCPKAKEIANEKGYGDGKISPMQQYDKYCEENKDKQPYLGSVSQKYSWDYRIREAVSIQIEKRKRSRKVKQCRFCDGTGHNKRTCPEIAKVKQLILDANKMYRRKAIEELALHGIGPGALFKGRYSFYENGSWKGGEGLAVVKDIIWSNILISPLLGVGARKQQSTLTIQWAMGHSETVHIPSSSENVVFNRYGSDYIIVAPSSPSSVVAPAGWLGSQDIEKDIKKALANRKITKRDFNVWTHTSKILEKWAGYTIHKES